MRKFFLVVVPVATAAVLLFYTGTLHFVAQQIQQILDAIVAFVPHLVRQLFDF